jgi:hypothetical protein
MNRAAQWGSDQRGTINEAMLAQLEARADQELEACFQWFKSKDTPLQERADQELEACCEWLSSHYYPGLAQRLRAARRPKPPSLKAHAREGFERILSQLYTRKGLEAECQTIRLAFEALPND